MYIPEKSRIMKAQATSKKEIEDKISKMGDYVKIGYLQSCLKNQLDFETRRFVLQTLSSLYESKKMFSDAGKCMRFAAEIVPTEQAKIDDLVKAVEMFVKAGNYDEAELTYKKALSMANEKQKTEMKQKIKNFYLAQSDFYMQKDKRKQAAEIYERVIASDFLDANEKLEIQKKLLELYENLGRIREFYVLKQKIGSA